MLESSWRSEGVAGAGPGRRRRADSFFCLLAAPGPTRELLLLLLRPLSPSDSLTVSKLFLRLWLITASRVLRN